jgi:hypothetical protein
MYITGSGGEVGAVGASLLGGVDMKRIRLVGVCLVVAAAICAVTAVSASAEPDRIPGTGACYAVQNGLGTFVEAGCEEYGAPKGYEWCWNDQEWPNPCPIPIHQWYWETTKFAMATAAKLEVKCTKLTGSGGYSDFGTAQVESAALSGCESRGVLCQSAGAEAGDVNTNALEGKVGFIDADEHQVGLELSAPSGVLMEFSCSGSAFAVRGSVVGTVPANKAESKLAISFKAKKGTQTTEGFEEAPPAKLELSVNDGPYEALGLTTKISQVNENKKTKVEIHCKNIETEAVEAC